MFGLILYLNSLFELIYNFEFKAAFECVFFSSFSRNHINPSAAHRPTGNNQANSEENVIVAINNFDKDFKNRPHEEFALPRGLGQRD